MTEITRPWAGTTAGDAGPYTAPHWWDVWQSMMSGNGAIAGAGDRGVFLDVPDRLLVTYTAPNTVQVAIGAAMVDGLFYHNTAAKNVTVSSASAGNVRDDMLVIRKNFGAVTQTARIVLIAGTENASPGPGTPPALTQDLNRLTYWDVPLARLSITELGVITVTDARKWLAGSAMVKLDEVVVGPGPDTVTFTNIPGGFRHLKLIISGRCSDHSAVANNVLLRFNGDTGTNYPNLLAQFSTVGGNYYWDSDDDSTAAWTGVFLPSTIEWPLGDPVGSGEVTIADYCNPLPHRKTGYSIGGYHGSTMAGALFVCFAWKSTAPITSIDVFCDSDFDAHPEFEAGSVITLYGIP